MTTTIAIHDEIENNKNQLQTVVKQLQENNEAAKVAARTKNCYGYLPLHYAMAIGKQGVFELVKLLVDLYPEGVAKHNNTGDLPIHCMKRSTTDDWQKSFAFLLNKYPEGAKVKNSYGRLPIHWAALYENVAATKLLLDLYPAGAKVKDGDGELPINKAGDNGDVRHLLINACNQGGKGSSSSNVEELKEVIEKYEKLQKEMNQMKKQLSNAMSQLEETRHVKGQLSNARRQLFHAIKAVSKVTPKILKNSDGWTVEELLSIAHSLNCSLNAIREHSGTRRSWSHECFESLLRQSDPTKENLLDSMAVIYSELIKLEGAPKDSKALGEAVDLVPSAVNSPETRPSKRAKGSSSSSVKTEPIENK